MVFLKNLSVPAPAENKDFHVLTVGDLIHDKRFKSLGLFLNKTFVGVEEGGQWFYRFWWVSMPERDFPRVNNAKEWKTVVDDKLLLGEWERVHLF